MNVSLSSELENFVVTKVASGMYQTASEVVREGLRLLREREENQKKLNELRREIALGLQQADDGNLAPLHARATLARIRKKRQSKARKKRP